jgi:hypothetical protein
LNLLWVVEIIVHRNSQEESPLSAYRLPLSAARREEIIDSRQKVRRRQSYMESDTGWWIHSFPSGKASKKTQKME